MAEIKFEGASATNKEHCLATPHRDVRQAGRREF
jgi:hypothetical protein